MTLVIGTKNTTNRVVKKEKYDFPVVTLHAKPEKAKGSYKISFNKAAVDLLNLTNEDEVSITVSLKNPVILVVTDLDCEKTSLYKDLSFASKPFHNCITKNAEYDDAIDNEVVVKYTEVDYDDGVIRGLEFLGLVSEMEQPEETAEEIIEAVESIEESQEVESNSEIIKEDVEQEIPTDIEDIPEF